LGYSAQLAGCLWRALPHRTVEGGIRWHAGVSGAPGGGPALPVPDRPRATRNVRSIVSDLSEPPAFLPHRYVLLAAAGGNCGAVTSFFPDSSRAAVTQAMDAYERSSLAAGA